jgi:hypothetical protein
MNKLMLCYLLTFPDVVEATTFPQEKITGLKDAPYFQPVDISVRSLPGLNLQIETAGVSITRQRYDERIQVVECHFELPDPLLPAGIQERERIQSSLRNQLIPKEYRDNGLYEEYVVLCLSKIDKAPDAFIEANAGTLAHFIRSQREMLDPAEIDEILVSRVRYSKEDLTLVDWEAAIIIAPKADFQSDIELLKIGNYQLLRYRILDQSIEDILQTINREFMQGKQSRIKPTRTTLRRIVTHRLEIALDFEHTDQNLLLIGDWYTAKLFAIIRNEFYLGEWKSAVRTKLDNLEGIVHTIQENFSLSWSGLIENVQLAGWVILLIGYFILFFLEVRAVK